MGALPLTEKVGIYLPFPSTKYPKNPVPYIWNKCKNTLEGGEEKANQLGNLRPRKRHGDKFPRFSLCLKYPKMDPRKANNVRDVRNARNVSIQRFLKAFNKRLISWAKGLDKGQSSKTESFWEKTTLLEPHTTGWNKNYGPTYTLASKGCWEHKLPSLSSHNEMPQPTCRSGGKESWVGRQEFHPQ